MQGGDWLIQFVQSVKLTQYAEHTFSGGVWRYALTGNF